MGWVDDYDVDSVLWIGGPGQEGLRTVAKMLDGEKTPSGKLADTYAANSLSSPAMQNCLTIQLPYRNSPVREKAILFHSAAIPDTDLLHPNLILHHLYVKEQQSQHLHILYKNPELPVNIHLRSVQIHCC